MIWQVRTICCCIALQCGGFSAAAVGAETDGGFRFSGDFRLRAESVQREAGDDTDRGRYRARFGLAADAAENVQLVFRLATGSGSPVSTNLNFGDGFSAKEIRVDRAYAEWRIDETWKLRAGRMKQPWFRAGGTQLIWDSDVNPDGVAAVYDRDAMFGSLGLMTVESRSAADDTLLLAAQGGYRLPLGGRQALTFGGSLYHYTDAAGSEPFFDGAPQGNRIAAAGGYRSGFRLQEVFAEYRVPVRGMPIRVFASVVRNSAADDAARAWSAGALAGEAASRGDLQVSYRWHDTEPDAVVGTFSHSDFVDGVTDSSGHVFGATYRLRQNIELGATAIVGESGASTGTARDYQRFMLDLAFSFD